jgi:hypothetical protein
LVAARADWRLPHPLRTACRFDLAYLVSLDDRLVVRVVHRVARRRILGIAYAALPSSRVLVIFPGGGLPAFGDTPGRRDAVRLSV